MKTILDLGDLGEWEYNVFYNYTPSTPDVYYMTNGDPGYPCDPEEIEIISLRPVSLAAPAVTVSDLTEAAYERICDEISEYEVSSTDMGDYDEE